jgi:adenylate kinase
MLEQMGMVISMVLALQVDEEELTRRLLERGKISGRADDQDEATIRNRFRVYNNETSPLLAFYQKQGKLQQVQGMGSVDEIFSSLCRCIDNSSTQTH